jgi:hypothetical protein
MLNLRLGKVVKVFPESNSVNLVMLDNSERLPMVQVLSTSASTNTGLAELTEPEPPAEDWDVQPTKRDIYAAVGTMGTTPVVLGFLFPQVTQLLFKEKNRRVHRHASDFYTSVDDAGNFEVFHPSGTYMRIGTTPEHEDLTGKDFDKKWKIERNTDKAVHVRLVVKNGGAEKVSLSATPDGNVALKNAGTLSADVAGAADIKVGGALTSSAPSFTHTGPMTLKGDLTVQGDVGVTKTVTAQTDVVGGGKSLKNHVHAGVQTGGGSTQPPT